MTNNIETILKEAERFGYFNASDMPVIIQLLREKVSEINEPSSETLALAWEVAKKDREELLTQIEYYKENFRKISLKSEELSAKLNNIQSLLK